MIIISNKDIENSVYFPRNIYTSTNDIYTVLLKDRGSNKEYTFEELGDRFLVQFGFYTFFVDFSELPEGEYEYNIIDSNDKLVGTGLIRLNSLGSDVVCYNNERTYIVYDGQ